MTIKMIQSRINIADGVYDVAILQSDVCHAYMLLDMLAENTLGEIYFYDASSGQKISAKMAADDKDAADGARIFLTDNSVGCIQQIIARCYLNPHDANWLHLDIEISSAQDGDAVLCMRLQ